MKPRTYWITKYALTKGVFTATRNDKWTKDDKKYVWVDDAHGLNGLTMYVRGKEAFETEAEARADERTRIENRLKSLRKQVAALEERLAALGEG